MKKIFLLPSVLWIPIKTRNIWIIYLDVCRFQFLSWDLAHCIHALACSVFGGRLALGWERSFETPDTWGAGTLALPHGSTHCAHRPGGSTTQAPSAALPHPTGFSRRLQSDSFAVQDVCISCFVLCPSHVLCCARKRDLPCKTVNYKLIAVNNTVSVDVLSNELFL